MLKPYVHFCNGLSACRLALPKKHPHLLGMRIFMALSLLIGSLAKGDLIPMPRSIQENPGNLIVDVQTAVIAPKNLAGHAEVLTKALQKTTGYVHRFRTIQQAGRMTFKRAIRLGLADSEKPGFYLIEVTPEGATITGSDPAGLMHGMQTFVQLLPLAEQPLPRALIPAQTIKDWPETARRIFHLDVSAHLFPAHEMKSLIDWLSFHKLTELHLLLNGDSGWRMESLKFPKLHEIGSVRASTLPYGDPTGSDSTEYGGYYTQEILRELVAYGQTRALEIVPAFTLTTGASALIASYPELGKEPVEVANTWEDRKVGILQDDTSHKFLETLFAEVATIFPAKLIRIEGRESAFHETLGTILAQQQKTLFLPGSIATTDFSVYPRPKESELLIAAKLQAEEGFNPVHQVYQLRPGNIAQATLRTRFVPEFGKLQYLVFPRIAAFAEVTWLPASALEYDDFRNRLDTLDKRYRLGEVTASKAYDPPAREALHKTIVTSSIEAHEGHPPVQIFDGRDDTFFWSAGGLIEGDHLTLEFPWRATGDLAITTGQIGIAEGTLETGVLEFSSDGTEWIMGGSFFNGAVSALIPDKARFARIRVTGGQDTALIMAELALSVPLLAPVHEESREVELPFSKEKIKLTFRADFHAHPELRDEVNLAREIFFKEWLSLAVRIGTAHSPDTPRDFEIQPGEPGQASPEETRQWLLKRLIPGLQKYPVSAPLWLATGIASRLLSDLPQHPVKSQYKEGGPQSAAFLEWLVGKFGEEILIAISQECRSGNYAEARWKFYTNKTLTELAVLYQDDK